MFALNMRLGLLALLCSATLASKPAQPPKQKVTHSSHKQEVVNLPPAEPSKNGTSHLRKGAAPTTESTKEQRKTEKDAGAIRGLVEGLASVPTKGGKVVKGFANKANHPSVRALQPKSQQSAKAKPVIAEEKPVVQEKPVSHQRKAQPVIAESKPVVQKKPVVHQPKVSEPKLMAKDKAKPVEKAKPSKAVPHHPALVARAYPSLVPMPAKMKPMEFHGKALTEEERAKKVQQAMDQSEEIAQSVDQDVEEAKKEAAEAHKIAHAK